MLLRGLLCACIVFCTPPVTLKAQISPGPLSRAHQSLEGTIQCAGCHKLGGGQPVFRCLDCHREIASRLASNRGLHATYGLGVSSQGCAKCHSEHNGRDFPLLKWNPSGLDHQQTGYVLEGKHASLACNRCHNAEHVAAAERNSIKVRDLNQTYMGLASACSSCHQDAHSGRLGANCQQCHGFNDWAAIPGKLDHSRTRYPLTGAHQPVACQKCHTAGPDRKPRFVGLAFGKCSDCHADPHRGAFAQQACASCHNTGGWKRISVAALNSNFDHAKTRYPLLGKHQQVECSQCHANGDFKKPLAFQTCTACHKDSHDGQFARRADRGECASCHTVDGFKPSTYGVNEHSRSAYPLEAKHAAVQCAKCHIPRGRDTQYRMKFSRCLDCHQDEHQGQFAAVPYLNRCEQCHTLNGYRPSTYSLMQHGKSRFVLSGGHAAVACGDCHKKASDAAAAPARYRMDDRSCTACHADPHNGQFSGRMRQALADGTPAGCEACHSTRSWKDLARFDHATTKFALTGSHRAVACIDCHKPENLETTLLHVKFTAAPAECHQCHADVHGGQFARADAVTLCDSCHNSAKWKPSLFDHDTQTTFQLQGVHKNVRCEGCHKLTRVVSEQPVLFYKPTARECAACHGPEVLKTNTGKSDEP